MPTGYHNNKAKVVGDFFEDWNAYQILKLAIKRHEVQEYISWRILQNKITQDS